MSEHERRRGADLDLIELQVKVGHLEKMASGTDKKVDELLAFMNQSKGGWKTIILVAGVAGSVGALLAKVAPFMSGMPK